jgi:cell division protein FtsI/penicillin-binding protein 2
MSVKVRRQLPITTDVWQRMVPGMVGAVNYGSGRKAYDPSQTVAGKTGTCIGDAGWVGLFTSYAPLANPRLAVVVITQGTDARRHLPAAVAGEIYRQLNHRFGTAINLQVASTLDDEEKEVADQEAAADAEANGETTETNGAATTATAPPVITTPVAPAAAKTSTSEPTSKVKRVLMPLEKKPVETPKNSTTSSQAPATTAPAEQQRPRRITPN